VTGSSINMVAVSPNQRVLLVGEYMWPWYQEACADALERQGCTVSRFGWVNDFYIWDDGCSEPRYRTIMHRVQYRLKTGPTVWRIEKKLLREAEEFNPSIVWFYNVQLIRPTVVRKMRQMLPNAIFVQYANDNPFSTTALPRLWHHYLASIYLFDIHFVYRHNNISDYQLRGSKNIHLLRSYFILEEDYPVAQEKIPERFKCDVVFAGHYEDDGRVEMLEAICSAGYKLNLFGGGWKAAVSKLRADSPLLELYPIGPATKDDYRYAICGAKVSLCFLSTLNCDTYTRRNFQIPAMKVAMLSQYSDDLADLFVEDKEVVFFKSSQDLLVKLERLLGDKAWRDSVATSGFEKVHSAGHHVQGRMKGWLEDVLSSQKLTEGSHYGHSN